MFKACRELFSAPGTRWLLLAIAGNYRLGGTQLRRAECNAG